MKIHRNGIAALFAGACAVPACAVTLPMGNASANLPSGTSTSADPSLGGTVISDTNVALAQGSDAATVLVRVVQSTSTGKYHYYWRVTNNTASPAALTSLAIRFWPDRAYDANWRTDSPGTAHPYRVLRSDDPSNPGKKLISFAFDSSHFVLPGQTSQLIFLKSDTALSQPATIYVTFRDGAITPDGSAVAPK